MDPLKKQRDAIDKATKMSNATAHKPKLIQSTIQLSVNIADTAVSALFMYVESHLQLPAANILKRLLKL